MIIAMALKHLATDDLIARQVGERQVQADAVPLDLEAAAQTERSRASWIGQRLGRTRSNPTGLIQSINEFVTDAFAEIVLIRSGMPVIKPAHGDECTAISNRRDIGVQGNANLDGILLFSRGSKSADSPYTATAIVDSLIWWADPISVFATTKARKSFAFC